MSSGCDIVGAIDNDAANYASGYLSTLKLCNEQLMLQDLCVSGGYNTGDFSR
ncbi:MAG: hypothetical protein IPG99_11665 [Ignavibacteria bacterium]|nr:hypothetical protein [Ignavibacteria bacterium]